MRPRGEENEFPLLRTSMSIQRQYELRLEHVDTDSHHWRKYDSRAI